jgi:glycosyltransferase involved in cell wall biosynthesis
VAGAPRLLILITLAEVGGAQTYVAQLLPALVGRFDVTVAAWGPGPLRDATARAGARYVALEHVRRELDPWQDLRGLVELVRLFRRERPHIVHANSSKAGFLGRLAAAITGVPIRIFTVHGWAFSAYSGIASKLYLWSDRLMRPLTTTIVCVAESERASGLRAGTCTRDRTVVIHNAVDAGAMPVADPGDGTPPVLVSVGRFKYPKDFVTLLKALALVGGSAFRTLIVGDGPDRPLIERELRELELDATVELTGERADVPRLLADADVFVLSSRSEGLPLSVLEAMAAGLPIVATRVGGVPELLTDDETGLLVPPANAEALATALIRVAGSPDLRRRLGASARRRALEQFDLPRFRREHLELYRDELARRGLPPPADA